MVWKRKALQVVRKAGGYLWGCVHPKDWQCDVVKQRRPNRFYQSPKAKAGTVTLWIAGFIILLESSSPPENQELIAISSATGRA